MKKVILYITLFFITGNTYYWIEYVYKHTTDASDGIHWSMAILGGAIGVLIGLLNEHGLKWEMPIWKQILYGEFIVLPLEFLAGVLLHKVINIQPPVWDYSNLPLSLWGQTSLTFAPMFIPCILMAILIDDWHRYWFMGGEKPRYKWI